MTIHPLDTGILSPRQFTYPFCYTPHPLCLAAAAQVQRHIASMNLPGGDDGGKMFGVLVVRAADGDTGFLAAYSGLLAGRNDWPYFVPPVFDAQRPDGHFKRTERLISAMNDDIKAMEHSYRYAMARQAYATAKADADAAIEAARRGMADAKARRDARRRKADDGGVPIAPDEQAAMVRESQFLKAELRRVRQHCRQTLDALRRPIDEHEERLAALRRRRRETSDDLQQWLFAQYRMLNARGEERNLTDIFRDTVHGVPPAGAGDCCAPKLLQYAYANGLRPLCMAEFWWGGSPRQEIRHHLHYYPACRSKCLPILTHMLRGLDVEPNPLERPVAHGQLRIVYKDDDIVVVDKPAGMLSVPGKSLSTDPSAAVDNACSAEEYVQRLIDKECAEESRRTVKAVHRLDMDTSGLLVLALNADAHSRLQRQFASRQVRKRYEAILDGVPSVPAHGTISLPLIADVMDRPRQRVDTAHGKQATTEYSIERTLPDGHTLVILWPHTGRTHQLRVHCAHAQGLATPILGDPLYGHGTRAARMCLHAAMIEFTHPSTGRRLRFESPTGWTDGGAAV